MNDDKALFEANAAEEASSHRMERGVAVVPMAVKVLMAAGGVEGAASSLRQ